MQRSAARGNQKQGTDTRGPTVRTCLAYLRNRVVGQCGLNTMGKEIADRQRPVEALQVMANHVIS